MPAFPTAWRPANGRAAVLARAGAAVCSGLLAGAILAACGDPLDPVGVFAADPDALAAGGLAAALGGDDPAAAFARARLADHPAAATPWEVTAQLRADGTFALTAVVGDAPARQHSGSWVRVGDAVELTTKVLNGRELPTPEVLTARLSSAGLHLQLAPGAPALVLLRRET
jgi:hypothetical protein